MAWDIALDPNTRDLVISPRSDVSAVTGTAVTEQRVRNRLVIRQGEWILDPTDGQLGSHMRDLARLPIAQAVTDAPRVVREALEPMDDIHLHDVQCSINPKDQRILQVQITYSVVEPGGFTPGDEQTLTTDISITE